MDGGTADSDPGGPAEPTATTSASAVARPGFFSDVCECSPDAMFVVESSGHIVYANSAAARFANKASADPADASPTGRTLAGLDFASLLTDHSLRSWSRVTAEFREQRVPTGLDLVLHCRHGSASDDSKEHGGQRTASAHFAVVQRDPLLSLITMRDVTSERAMANELSTTKESLERVIESSVDAIVSADLGGHILLYNQAAARLFGYPQDEVLGKMLVTQLYPADGAREVMKRIRSKAYGGRGRLHEYRVDMLNARGERVPVTLSASLVLDGKRAVGTVGIFTDIREKLEMENALARTQLELQTHDKRAALAELAGAAAHELNQPLTSVMGYAEFLKRSLGEDETLHRAVDVILRETDRMADIVRKVGQITRYETKDYVGGARIVDIDASSARESPPPKGRVETTDESATDRKLRDDEE